jgi:hypothetical protein
VSRRRGTRDRILTCACAIDGRRWSEVMYRTKQATQETSEGELLSGVFLVSGPISEDWHYGRRTGNDIRWRIIVDELCSKTSRLFRQICLAIARIQLF